MKIRRSLVFIPYLCHSGERQEKETAMAPMITIESATRAINRPYSLSDDRDEWSSSAESAYRHVLWELDAWSGGESERR